MKVGTKLTLALIAPLVALTGLYGWVDEIRSRDRLMQELVREGRAISKTVQIAMVDYLDSNTLAEAHELIDKITLYERVLGLRLFDERGILLHESSSLVDYPFANMAALRETVLGRRETFESSRFVGDEPAVTFLLPLVAPDDRLLGAVQVLQLQSYIDREILEARKSIVVLGALAILGVGATLLFVTRASVGKPIERLVRSFRDASSGDFRARVPVGGPDELGRLAAEFNAMCERLESARRSLEREQLERRRVEAELRRSERLASVGRLAAGLAHEIGTPLGVIKGRAETALRDGTPPERVKSHLAVVSTQIDRIERIVRGLLDFARAREIRVSTTDVGEVARQVVEFLDQRFHSRGIVVDVRLAPDVPPVEADADRLTEVFLNLAMNAIDAMPGGGTLEIRIVRSPEGRARAHGDPSQSFVAATFEDTGTGMPPEVAERAFDPFFTTKDVGLGTGLGLSIAFGVVKEHGGWLDLDTEPGRGTRVTVNIPAAKAAEAVTEPTP